MTRELRSVMWKEFNSLPIRGRKGTRANFQTFIPLVLFGVVFPLTLPATALPIFMYFYIVPVTSVVSVIPDSFAGEKERHTLETLLATPLSELSILAGKVLTTVAYAMVLTVVTIGIALFVLGIRHHSLDAGLIGPVSGGILLSVSFALLYANVGALISLRATTVRQAQQVLGFLLSVPFLLLAFLPVLLKSGRTFFQVMFGRLPFQTEALVAAAVAALGLMLGAAAIALFRRPRLIGR